MSSHLLKFQPVHCYSSYNTINLKRWNLSKANWILVPGPRDSIDAYRRSNSCFKFLFVQSRRRSKWMKTTFQTPSSTSCSRSTTSMSKMLKLSSASLSEMHSRKVDIQSAKIVQKKKWKILTAVETRDSSFSRFSTATLSIPEFLTYMALCTALMQLCCCTSSTCARDLHCVISWGIPMLCTWSIGMRHQGQGQRPRLRMPAKSILRHVWAYNNQSHRENLLLFIIGRMCKYMRVKAPTNFVMTFYHHFMPIHLQKVIIEDEWPLSMIQFSSTMC